jgi:hypothetical protein
VSLFERRRFLMSTSDFACQGLPDQLTLYPNFELGTPTVTDAIKQSHKKLPEFVLQFVVIFLA